MYTVVLTRAARRSLSSLPKSALVRIDAQISSLTKTLFPRGSKKLKSTADLYRLRVGDYRIIYHVHKKQLTIVVVRIGHRKEIYKGGLK